MALNKVPYVDGVTVITAENLNDIQDAIIALENAPAQGLTEDMKQALLQIARKVAYIDDQGQTYYDDLYDAFYPPKTVVLITAVFNQGTTVIYDDTALDDLKQYLTVTAKYDDNTTAILADSAYTLSGLLEAGTSTVTVAYNGLTTTFTVNVTARPTLFSISAVYANESANVPISSSMRSNSYILANGTWGTSNDSYTFVIPVTVGKAYRLKWVETDAALAGTIFRWGFSSTNTPSGQLISAWNRYSPQSYSDVTVKAVDSYMLIQVSAAYGDAIATNGYLEITEFTNSVFDSGTLDVLKQNLVVTANYSGGSSEILDADDYELSGSLDVGLDTITVSYGGKTATFTAVVTAPLYSIPDFAEQRVTYGNKYLAVAKSGNYYTFEGTSGDVVYISPSGVASATKGNSTWFSTIAGKSFRSIAEDITWNNQTSSAITLNTKFSRSETTGNLYSTAFEMTANNSGVDGSAVFDLASASYSRDLADLALQFSNNPGTGQTLTATLKVMVFVDGVRYL